MSRSQVQLHNSPTLFKRQVYSPGLYERALSIVSGARLVFTIYCFAADPGAVATVRVKTKFSESMPANEVLTFQISSSGEYVKRILTDFHHFLDVDLEITGGDIEIILGMTVFDNALSTRIENAEISADLNHTIQPNGKYDSVRVGDGAHELDILPDGSIKANIVQTSVEPEEVKGVSNRITGLAQGTPTLLGTYTAPPAKKSYLQLIEVSGENIADYWVEIDGVRQRTRRTYFSGPLNTVFDYQAFAENGFEFQPGEKVDVKVEHDRPDAATFDSYIQVLEIG